jgi:hydrogenase expression/formation protein HypE
MRAHPLGRDAVIVGAAVAQHPGVVALRTAIGGTRVVDMLPGDQLPRIC